MKELFECPHCGKKFNKLGIKTHIWRCHTEEGKKFSPFKGKTGWNKGQTKETNENVKKYAETLKRKYKNGEITGSFLGKHHSEETKKKLSEAVKRNKNQKKFNKHVISKYEQIIIDVLNEHNIKFKHNFTLKIFTPEKRKFYFLDIALIDLLVDIETDGWEHDLQERKIHDTKRDKLMESIGWKILRLKNKKIEDMYHDDIFTIINDFLNNAKNDIGERKNIYEENQKKYYTNFKGKIKTKIKNGEKKKPKPTNETIEKIEKIKNSNIDFTKRGCINEMSKLTGIPTQHCSRFLKHHFPDIYNLRQKQKEM